MIPGRPRVLRCSRGVTFGLLRRERVKTSNEGRVGRYPAPRGARELRILFSASGPKSSDPPLVSEVHKGPLVEGFGEQPRAQRITIHTPLRYRVAGGEWQEGTMVNISESGVLFRTSQKVPSIREIEMQFSLQTARGAAVQMACRGVIARTVSFPGSAEPTGLAARITKLHLKRPARGPRA